MSATGLDVHAVRERFSSLRGGFAFFDAPGGTQVPDEVADAVARALRETGGNMGAPYATGERIAKVCARAEEDAARLLGCETHEVMFGLNMTSLNFMLSRTVARDLREGDEVLVSRLDHDAGVAPWRELAHDRGIVVRHVDVREDLTLDLDDLEGKLTDRTRVVAFAWAANSVGTVTDAERVCALAHEAGALAWIDAVHFAAHEAIDVAAVGADVLLCSAYKFCGPRLGIGFGRAELLERLRPYKVGPAPDHPLGRRFATGTQPFELLAGFSATVDYLASVGGAPAIRAHERALGERFMATLPETVTVYGRPDMQQRVPTYLLNVDAVPSQELSRRLAERGMGAWSHTHYYALGLRERLPYPDQALRVGFAHYNTAEEVDRLVAELTAAGREASGGG